MKRRTSRSIRVHALSWVLAVLALFSSAAQRAWAETPTAPGAPAAAPSSSAPPAPTPSPPAAAPSPAPSAGAAPDALVPPKLLKDVQPEYPAAAREQGIAAQVVLELDIDVAGRVENAVVVQGAEAIGFGFDEAALAAAKLLEFTPATENGQPVPVRIGYRFRFVPGPVEPEAPAATVPPAPSDPANLPTKAAPPIATGQLWGTLTEQGTRLPLSGVKVTVFRGEGAEAEGFETETDADGTFRLNDLGVGKWRLLADPVGYYPLRTTEEVRANSRTDVSYRIERGAYNPYDVEVDTKRVQREVNHIAIDARQAERIPGTFGDVLAVVENFPGVARGGGGFLGGVFVIRGSEPEDSKILVSDVEVPLLYHFGQLRSVLPVGMIEEVNFYPGNFSVQYGRATGGVVDVELKDLNRTQLGGYADVNFFDTSLYLEVPVTDEFSFALAGRRSYIAALLNAALGGSGNSILAPRYYDAQALVQYQPSAAHQVRGFFFFSDDRFEVLFANPVAADATNVITDIGLRLDFWRTLAEYKYVPSPTFENEVKVSFGRDKQSFNVGELLEYELYLYQGQVRETARYAFSDQVALRAGVDYLFQDRKVEAILPEFATDDDDGGGGGGDPGFSEQVAVDEDEFFHSSALFAELELWPWQNTAVVPGVRVDHFSRTDNVAVSPRVVARQTLSPQWTLKGGVGLFQQEPTFEETDSGSGNPNLGLEKAIHYSAGVEYTPLEHLSLDVTGFYKTLSDLSASTDETRIVDGEAVPLNFNNEGEGRVIGLEVSARHELHEDIFGWVAYTLSRSERKDPGDATYRLFDYDQTHILTLIGSYRLPRNWEIGSRFRYVTGNLYTPVTGAVYDADADEYAPTYGEVNSDRVDDFHQLDVRIDKRWIFDSWMLNAYLDIQNVYNRANADNVEYNYDYSKTQKQQSLPIVPVLGLRGEF